MIHKKQSFQRIVHNLKCGTWNPVNLLGRIEFHDPRKPAGARRMTDDVNGLGPPGRIPARSLPDAP
jgi:hypothetical protein